MPRPHRPRHPAGRLFCVPTLANAGSPLILLGIGHLVLGNLAIGLFEAAIIARVLRIRFGLVVAPMIGANYASAAAGAAFLWLVSRWFGSTGGAELIALRDVGWLVAATVALTFILTLAIEAPFAWWGTRRTAASPAKRMLAFALSQVLSYAGLLAVYAALSDFSMLTHATHERSPAAITRGVEGWVFYIHRDELWRIRLDGTSAAPTGVRVATRSPNVWRDQLWARNRPDGSTADVFFNGNVILPGVPGWAGQQEGGDGPGWPDIVWPTVMDHSDSDAARPRFLAIGRAVQYLDPAAGERSFSLGLATPGLHWAAYFPTMLPNGAAVFQCGPYIAVIDRDRRIAQLAVGGSPAVVLDATP